MRLSVSFLFLLYKHIFEKIGTHYRRKHEKFAIHKEFTKIPIDILGKCDKLELALGR